MPENETNKQRLWGAGNDQPYVKDRINDAVVHCPADRVNPDRSGTKAAAHYRLTVPAGRVEPCAAGVRRCRRLSAHVRRLSSVGRASHS